MKHTLTRARWIGLGLCLMTAGLVTAQERIKLYRNYDELGFLKAVPVHLTGFTPQVEQVLKQDLMFMGLDATDQSQAKFIIRALKADGVAGEVIEKINNQRLLAKAYRGGTWRSQTHAFADDIAEAITGQPGIAQTKIAFKVESGKRVNNFYIGEIYIADYDGYNAQPITRDGTGVAAPCWSGSGRIFYGSYKFGPCAIFSHDLATGARRVVARYSGLNTSPAVSPDGTKLAMILSKSGSPDLFVSDLNGGNLRQLTFTREAESSPCWSPDSKTICYVSRSSGAARLYAIAASGGSPRLIRTAGAPNPTEPDWSPDGRYIIFTSQMRRFQLFLVPSEGGTALPLVEGEDPSWAPNSRAVVFARGPDHEKTLSLLDVPTKRVKTIPRILRSNSQPSWAR